MTYRTPRILALGILILASGCGPKVVGSAAPQAPAVGTEQPASTATRSELAPLFEVLGSRPKTRRLTYDLATVGCETGYHVAYGVEEFCQNLQLDLQNNNNNCSADRRQELFARRCKNRVWNPKASGQRLHGPGEPYFFCRLYDGELSPLQLSGSGYLELGTHSGRKLLAILELSNPDKSRSSVNAQFRVEVLSTEGLVIGSLQESWTQQELGSLKFTIGDESKPLATCLVRAQN